jgi:hypothetical protein
MNAPNDLTVNMRRALWHARTNGGSLRIGKAQPGGGMDKRAAYALLSDASWAFTDDYDEDEQP